VRELRPYQHDACQAVRAEWAKGVARTVVVLPTGAGKTDVIASLATGEAAAGGRVLIAAHRSELLDQLAERCRMHRPDIPVGRVQASKDQRGFPITVATVQTVARPARQARMPKPTLVIVDEVHHVASPTYVALLRWAGCFDGTARMFGVTATLTRADKRGLGDVIESVAFERGIEWGVAEGWLVQPRGRVVVADHLDLSRTRISRGDYVDTELGSLVAQDADQIAKAWLSHGEDRPTVAFCPTVASGQALADEFRAQGVPVGEVYGTTPTAERTRVFHGVTNGSLRVLVNVAVATEGLDLPVLSCALIARPTRIPALFQQMVGRVLRLHPSKTDGALVLDVVGGTRSQQLVTLVDLSPTFERDASELDVMPCPDCGGFKPKAVAADPELVPCSCEREQGLGRDPDGGRLRLQGPARYEDIPLLPDPKAKYRWLRSRLGVPFLVGSSPWCRDRVGIVYPDSGCADSPTWTPGHVAVRGPTSWVRLDDAPLSFAEAQERVQAWAGPSPRVPSGRAPDWLVDKATRLGVVQAWRLDRRGLQDAVDVARVSVVVDR
jgi:superfamily II DNA or RNA helicase